MSNVELLRKIPMFEALSDADAQELAGQLKVRRLPAGQHVFREGQLADSMFIVADGLVNVYLMADASTKVSLATFKVGQYFGELALLDGKPRSASAMSMSNSVLMELDRAVLTNYIEHHPGAAMSILCMMSERIRKTNAMLTERVAKNALEEFEKGLSWADRLADRVSELNGSWAFIIMLGVITALWMFVNWPWLIGAKILDPYPYQFFNLVLAVLVALQGPLIVMSQNRQAAKDRHEAENDFKVNLKNELNIETILQEMRDFRAEIARQDAPRQSSQPAAGPAKDA